MLNVAYISSRWSRSIPSA